MTQSHVTNTRGTPSAPRVGSRARFKMGRKLIYLTSSAKKRAKQATQRYSAYKRVYIGKAIDAWVDAKRATGAKSDAAESCLTGEDDDLSGICRIQRNRATRFVTLPSIISGLCSANCNLGHGTPQSILVTKIPKFR